MSNDLDLASVVQQSSAPQQIAEHFVSAIAVGALAPGDALPPERELAGALTVSRSSLRLALDRLERWGLIERRRGRGGGTFVRKPESPDTAHRELLGKEMREFLAQRATVLDARALLQRLISEAAANRREQADIAAIDAAWRDHATHLDAVSARRTDGVFHAAIATAAKNPVLADQAVQLDTRINIGFRHDPFSSALHATAVQHHEEIATAIADGDAGAAGHLAERHFRATTIDPMG